MLSMTIDDCTTSFYRLCVFTSFPSYSHKYNFICCLSFPNAGLMEKDLGLAVDIATKTKVRTPLGSQAHQIYGMLSDHG